MCKNIYLVIISIKIDNIYKIEKYRVIEDNKLSVETLISKEIKRKYGEKTYKIVKIEKIDKLG